MHAPYITIRIRRHVITSLHSFIIIIIDSWCVSDWVHTVAQPIGQYVRWTRRCFATNTIVGSIYHKPEIHSSIEVIHSEDVAALVGIWNCNQIEHKLKLTIATIVHEFTRNVTEYDIQRFHNCHFTYTQHMCIVQMALCSFIASLLIYLDEIRFSQNFQKFQNQSHVVDFWIVKFVHVMYLIIETKADCFN